MSDLTSAGIEVLYDDREDRAGVKFKDADLMGTPIQIVAGKAAAEGNVEIRDRTTHTPETVPASDVVANVKARMAQE